MSNHEITMAVASLRAGILTCDQQKERLLLELKQVRDRCPHDDVKTWTNNDGDGQFRVHLCNVCGLQKDGPL